MIRTILLIISVNFCLAQETKISANVDSCYVLLAVHKSHKLKIREKMSEFSRTGMFFYEGYHMNIIFKNGFKIKMGEIIGIKKDSLLLTTRLNYGPYSSSADTTVQAISDITKIRDPGYILSKRKYKFSSYKIIPPCYITDLYHKPADNYYEPKIKNR